MYRLYLTRARGSSTCTPRPGNHIVYSVLPAWEAGIRGFACRPPFATAPVEQSAQSSANCLPGAGLNLPRLTDGQLSGVPVLVSLFFLSPLRCRLAACGPDDTGSGRSQAAFSRGSARAIHFSGGVWCADRSDVRQGDLSPGEQRIASAPVEAMESRRRERRCRRPGEDVVRSLAEALAQARGGGAPSAHAPSAPCELRLRQRQRGRRGEGDPGMAPPIRTGWRNARSRRSGRSR